MDTGLVHCVMCLLTPELSLVLTAPTHEGGQAELSYMGGWLHIKIVDGQPSKY